MSWEENLNTIKETNGNLPRLFIENLNPRPSKLFSRNEWSIYNSCTHCTDINMWCVIHLRDKRHQMGAKYRSVVDKSQESYKFSHEELPQGPSPVCLTNAITQSRIFVIIFKLPLFITIKHYVRPGSHRWSLISPVTSSVSHCYNESTS